MKAGESTGRKLLRCFCVAMLLALAALLIAGCDKEKPKRSMLTLTEDERRQKVEDDLRLIRRYDEGLSQTLTYAAGKPELFPKDEASPLDAQQRHELRFIWQAVIDYMRALDGVKRYWKKFHKYNPVTQRRAHAEAFLVGYAAWLVQYRHGLHFIDLTVPSKPMEKLLDEKVSRYDIPADSFAKLKWNIIHVKAVTRFLGSNQYYKTVMPALRDADCDRKAWCGWAMRTVDNYHVAAKDQLRDRAAVQFSYNAFDIVRDMSFDAWFPIQKNVASWMGDTKVKRLHRHLVSKEQLDEMREKLQPGDIVVARHNWYLSNVGLPGFWPHAELYVGSEEELRAYFDDPEVKSYFDEFLDSPDVISHLKKVAPEAWKSYREAESDGHPHRVIEAISEGVVFSSFEKAAGADYVAAMRPRRKKIGKALAIARAFEQWGKPYDFNFDFTTDESLVCTELVYKSWRPSEHGPGIKFDLMEVMGRATLPANDLVRQFDEKYGSKKRPLDFVYFLDGREKKEKAVVSTLETFRRSWKRPKWDPLQK